MPQRLWHHICEDGTGILIEGPECCICLGAGEFDGWHLTPAEVAACYEYVFGIQSAGPHRRLADTVFRGMRRTCTRCGGEAVLIPEAGVTTAAQLEFAARGDLDDD